MALEAMIPLLLLFQAAPIWAAVFRKFHRDPSCADSWRADALWNDPGSCIYDPSATYGSSYYSFNCSRDPVLVLHSDGCLNEVVPGAASPGCFTVGSTAQSFACTHPGSGPTVVEYTFESCSNCSCGVPVESYYYSDNCVTFGGYATRLSCEDATLTTTRFHGNCTSKDVADVTESVLGNASCTALYGTSTFRYCKTFNVTSEPNSTMSNTSLPVTTNTTTNTTTGNNTTGNNTTGNNTTGNTTNSTGNTTNTNITNTTTIPTSNTTTNATDPAGTNSTNVTTANDTLATNTSILGGNTTNQAEWSAIPSAPPDGWGECPLPRLRSHTASICPTGATVLRVGHRLPLEFQSASGRGTDACLAHYQGTPEVWFQFNGSGAVMTLSVRSNPGDFSYISVLSSTTWNSNKCDVCEAVSGRAVGPNVTLAFASEANRLYHTRVVSWGYNKSSGEVLLAEDWCFDTARVVTSETGNATSLPAGYTCDNFTHSPELCWMLRNRRNQTSAAPTLCCACGGGSGSLGWCENLTSTIVNATFNHSTASNDGSVRADTPPGPSPSAAAWIDKPANVFLVCIGVFFGGLLAMIVTGLSARYHTRSKRRTFPIKLDDDVTLEDLRLHAGKDCGFTAPINEPSRFR